MATVPVEATAVPEEASRGPSGDEKGASLDVAHARSSSVCEVHDRNSDNVNYCNSGGGGAGCYESGDGSNEVVVATGSVSTEHSASTVYGAPSISAGDTVNDDAGDGVKTCEFEGRAQCHVTGVATEALRANGTEATPSTAPPDDGNATGGDETPASAAAAAALGGKNGNFQSGKMSTGLVEPALVPPSVHYGIYVNNIAVDVEDDQLKALFKPYGKVLRMKLVRRPEFTSFLFAYVLLDSDDNTKRAIQELNGTVLNGHALKMEATFGRTTHIFGIGEGTPYNRSRAAMEDWRQKRDARQANGDRNNRLHDDQWRRGNNDRNYRQGDRRYGDWNNGNRHNGDRGNYYDGRQGGGGHDRSGGYYQKINQYNNRCDNNRNFSRRGGCRGDGGGDPGQHGQNSFGGRNHGGGYKPANQGQWCQRGGGQYRNDNDFGRRGNGGHDGGNRSAEDGSHVNQMIFREARKNMRDAWNARLERMAAEGNDEEWPTFDELLNLVRDTPYTNQSLYDSDMENEPEDDGVQLVFRWSSDSTAGGVGGGTGLELLRFLHGDDAVAEVFPGVAEAAESGGADSEKRAPREDLLDVLENHEDAVAIINADGGVGNAAVPDKRVKACLEQENLSAKEREVRQQPIPSDESTLADGKAESEGILPVEQNTKSRAVSTSEKKNSWEAEEGVSGRVCASSPSILTSSADVSVDSLDLSTIDNSEHNTLPSNFVSRCSVSLPNLTEGAEDISGDRQVNWPQRPLPLKANDDKGSHAMEQPPRKVDSATECAGEKKRQLRGSSMNTELATTANAVQGIVRGDSVGPTATDNTKREAAAASQYFDPGHTERNLNVADELQLSVETMEQETGREEADAARTVAAIMADRAAALSAWNMGPEAEEVWDSEECESEIEDGCAGNDESDYSTEDSEALCEDAIVRMKNAKNVLNLSAPQRADEFSSVHGEGEGRLPSERPAALNVISQPFPANGDAPPQSDRFDEFEVGNHSNSIAVHASLAETDLHNSESGGMTKAEELASMARRLSEQLCPLLQDGTGGDLPTCTVTGGSGEREAKPDETRPFHRTKRRQRQNVADSIAQCSASSTCPPGNTSRENEICEGDNRDVGAVARGNKQKQAQGEVDEGVQTSSALGQGGNKRAARHPRKRVFVDGSNTDDEMSDSNADESVHRTTPRAKLGEQKGTDDADYPGEGASDVVVQQACVATNGKEGRLIEQCTDKGGASEDHGTSGDQATGGDVEVSFRNDVTFGSDGVTSDSVAGRDASGPDCGEMDREAEWSEMTFDGVGKGAQDGDGGAQQTAHEQGPALSSRASGVVVDSSETGRRDDAVDTRRSPRASRRDEEIECKPGDDGD